MVLNLQNTHKSTRLHHVIEGSRAPRTIVLLISHGADISAKDDEGWSALDLAAKRHKEAAVQALGDAGLLSKPLVKDDTRQTPIQVAEKNEAQIVDAVLTHQ